MAHEPFIVNDSDFVSLILCSVMISFRDYVQTIRYRKEETNVCNNGEVKKSWVDVEKQTTSDRLKRVEFDPEATWELLK